MKTYLASVRFSEAEIVALTELIMPTGRHGTIASVINTAIWVYATKQLGLDIPPMLFSATGRPEAVPQGAAVAGRSQTDQKKEVPADHPPVDQVPHRAQSEAAPRQTDPVIRVRRPRRHAAS